MSIEFAFLADRPDAIPVVASWYFEEWGRLKPGETLERSRNRLREYMNRDRLPFILIALKAGEIIGVAGVKIREMAELFPDREHWIGGVLIAPGHRRKGYGSLLVEAVADAAQSLGVRTLHLQTEAPDGGMYARLGWIPYATVNSRGMEVLIMERPL